MVWGQETSSTANPNHVLFFFRLDVRVDSDELFTFSSSAFFSGGDEHETTKTINGKTTMDLEREIATLQRDTSSPRVIALTRQRLLLETNEGLGLPIVICRVLREAIDAFLKATSASLRRHEESSSQLDKDIRTKCLRDCLQIHLKCSRLDPSLSLELGAQGTHGQLRRIIQFELDGEAPSEEDSDVVMELQDMACEISALYANFPMKTFPFTPVALRERLPLTFIIRSDSDNKYNKCDENNVADKETVLIHQIATRQSAQEDVGFGE